MLLERHRRFAALHEDGCFVIPNPWDAGSARVMAGLGAVALATSSAAYAFTLGRPDMGLVTRDEALRHAEDIVRATPLPVSGDLENGFADAPDGVAETIRLAAEAGLSGCSIEDTAMTAGNPAYGFDLAVDRIRAFEAAGADLLYVPLPPGPEELGRVVAAVSRPVNALAAGPLQRLGVAGLAALGVRRISLGSTLARVTHGVIVRAMEAILDQGDFTGLAAAMPGRRIDALSEQGSAQKGA